MAFEILHAKKYEAAARWKKDCLLADGSLFSEDHIWTKANFDELVKHYVQNLDDSKRSFMTKLEEQLALSSASAKQLAAELLWAMNLFTASLKPTTKISKMSHVWAWSGRPFPGDHPLLDPELLGGIGSTGPGYQNHFWLELSYIIETLAAFKGLDQAARGEVLDDPWKLASYFDDHDGTKSRQLRHIVPYLFFPNTFESIASRGHKKAILLAFGTAEEKTAVRWKDRQSIDRILLDIRARLERDYGKNFNYYDETRLLNLWIPKDTDTGSIDPDDSGSAVGESRAFESALRAKYGDARFWIIAPGRDARLWPDFLRLKAIAIGFEEFGPELKTLDADSIYATLAAIRSDGRKPTNIALAAREFSQVIREGDYVFAKQGRSKLLGFGRIGSDYRYDPSFPEYHHVRSVEWLRTGTWTLDSEQQVSTKALTEVTEYPEWLRYALALIGEELAVSRPVTVAAESPGRYAAAEVPYGKLDALEKAFIDELMLNRLMRAWDSRRNLILQGAPGTGKSWLARRLAWYRLGEKDEKRFLALQFHQSYAYEDFVRGWRPGKAQFDLVDGPFLEFCARARADSDRAYVLLIDEINRGNLSRIFGELLSLLEADKRKPEYAVRLASPRDGEPPFYIPENLYVVGTMNTADRSLAVVDYALRRRFVYFTLEPAYERDEFANHLAESVGVDPDMLRRIVDSFRKLNEAIAADRTLGPGYRIGHSFFTTIDGDREPDDDWFEEIVRTEIMPLLEEYWFDKPEKVREWAGRLIP